MRLSLSEATTEEGRAYQVVTARWKLLEENGIKGVYAQMNDENRETYSRRENWGEYNPEAREASVGLIIPDYFQSGTYSLNYIKMVDVALNARGVYFTDPGHSLRDEQEIIDELPATIDIVTPNPDSTPPVLDLNRITIQAEPTNPEAPNGETQVDITFRVKDNISGYLSAEIMLRDPQGIMHRSLHGVDGYKIYFRGDPTVYKTYHHRTILPVGSAPGTWGLAEMTVSDKAQNALRADFTEIVRFELEEGAAAAPVIATLPNQTSLLANYPNPFNPETWIPYQLATGSDVQITIYDVKGMLVRTLALGHQAAGYYTGRSRAAYWDGRNGFGERVASGVYFYQLQADTVSFQRKMVILK